MAKLLGFELKKLFIQQKGIFLFAIMIAVILIFIYSGINKGLSAQYQKLFETNNAISEFEKSGEETGIEKIGTAYYYSRLSTLKQKKMALENYNWRDELTFDMQLQTVEIDHLKTQGITDDDSLKSYKEKIDIDSFWLKQNIQPVEIKTSVMGPFFIINFFITIFPFFISLLLIVTVCDTASKEAEDGTTKLLLIQPIRRTKILAAKSISALIYNLSFITAGVLPIYLILNLTNSYFTGFGSMNYPVKINANLFAPIFSSQNVNTVSVPVSTELLYTLIAAFVAIFMLTAFSILLTSIFSSSSPTIMAAIIAAVILYGVNNLINSLTIVKALNPLSYTDCVSLIEGGAGAFFNLSNGFAVMLLLSFLFLIAGSVVFKKRNYSN